MKRYLLRHGCCLLIDCFWFKCTCWCGDRSSWTYYYPPNQEEKRSVTSTLEDTDIGRNMWWIELINWIFYKSDKMIKLLQMHIKIYEFFTRPKILCCFQIWHLKCSACTLDALLNWKMRSNIKRNHNHHISSIQYYAYNTSFKCYYLQECSNGAFKVFYWYFKHCIWKLEK